MSLKLPQSRRFRRCKCWRTLLVLFVLGLLMYQLEIFFGKPVGHVFVNDIHEASCNIPVLDPFDPSIQKFLRKPKPFVCDSNPSIVYVDEFNVLRVNTSAHAQGFYGISSDTDLACVADSVHRPKEGDDVDNLVVFGDRTALKLPAKLKTDVTCVKCKKGAKVVFDKCVAGIGDERAATKPQISDETEEQPSVILIGIDSVSRPDSIRGLPKTLEYLQTLGFYDFRGFMKIGDNTHPNLFGMLTGKMLYTDETPGLTKFMDNWPYLWKNFSDKNYVTLYGEDERTMSFLNTPEMKGFFHAPTDHYLKPLLVAEHQRNPLKFYSTEVIGQIVDKTQYKICHQNTRFYQDTINFLKLFITRYKKKRKFSLEFISAITHEDTNYLLNADDDFLELFRWMKDGGVFETSIVIFFSDHGPRYSKIRNSFAGRLESRMPMLHVLLPEHIKTKYPEVDTSLKINTHRLVSMFDVHQTLVDILNSNYKNPSSQVINGKKRGISLFQEIPSTRSCKDAGVSMEFCACYKSEPIDVTNNPLMTRNAEQLVEHINNIIAVEPKCQKLALHQVVSAEKMSAGLRYHSTNHNWLSLYKLFSPETENRDSYSVIIQTKPGLAQFDVTCVFGSNGVLRDVINVDRTNEYGNQSSCTDSNKLVQYCYC